MLDSEPVSVSAKGVSYIQRNIEDVVFITILFENDIVAHIHVSWLDPNKVRKMTFVGSKKMIVYIQGIIIIFLIINLDGKFGVFPNQVFPPKNKMIST